MIDYLYKASLKKQKGKQAIKEKKMDEAWKYFLEQKEYYLQHAQQFGFDLISTQVIESSVHQDLAHILRLESKHKNALSHLSYVYKVTFVANRPIITLEKKLKNYFSKAYSGEDFLRFKKLLEMLSGMDYVSIRDFVEIYYPKIPKNMD